MTCLKAVLDHGSKRCACCTACKALDTIFPHGLDTNATSEPILRRMWAALGKRFTFNTGWVNRRRTGVTCSWHHGVYGWPPSELGVCSHHCCKWYAVHVPSTAGVAPWVPCLPACGGAACTAHHAPCSTPRQACHDLRSAVGPAAPLVACSIPHACMLASHEWRHAEADCNEPRALGSKHGCLPEAGAAAAMHMHACPRLGLCKQQCTHVAATGTHAQSHAWRW